MDGRALNRGRKRVSGFTLVEILVAIVIIGMLTGFLGVAITGAMRRAREATVTTEISLLHNAMNDFKSKYGAYPPGLGTPIDDTPGAATASYVSETSTMRQSRIIRFVNKAFPRYSLTSSPIPYLALRNDLGAATLKQPILTQAPGAGTNVPTGAPFWAAGALNCCDIETLDPAEALVFWLGGLAKQRTGADGRTVFEMTGFSANPSAPFRLAVTQAEFNAAGGNAAWTSQGYVGEQRTAVLFPFDNSRLADADGDNWPEYYPKMPGSLPSLNAIDGTVPPYVYFSSAEYNLHPAYPYYDGPDADVLAEDNATSARSELIFQAPWGLAKPFASTISPAVVPANLNNWQITWVQPDGFQIIAAGVNNDYGVLRTNDVNRTPVEAPQLTRTFPAGAIYGGAAVSDLPPETNDNMTNFSTGRLEGEMKAKK